MNYRNLPKVDKVLSAAKALLGEAAALPLLTECARKAVESLRSGAVESPEDAGREELLALAAEYAAEKYRKMSGPSLKRVINAAGVVLHTNLGRSVMAEQAARAAYMAASGYCNVEMDLDTGLRGSRYDHIEELLCRLTGAEAAVAVNNNAAAVMVVLDTLAKGGEAVISRGQLVEIGGGFRIPEVITGTGAVLREVGATNKTHLYDYENAISEVTSCLLQVHTSNFYMCGFVESVGTEDLSRLAHEHGLPLIYDLGSGSLYPFADRGVGSEPVPARLIAQGADVLTFSGDKMLGGPQCGLIVGRREYIERIKKNPLMRAIRPDKMTMAALQATLMLYRDGRETEIPTVAMLTADGEELKARAQQLADALAGKNAQVHVRPGISPVGGGSLPEVQLPAWVVETEPHCMTAAELLRVLRLHEPAVLGYNRENRACFDLRTVLPQQMPELIAALQEVLG